MFKYFTRLDSVDNISLMGQASRVSKELYNSVEHSWYSDLASISKVSMLDN